MYNPILSDTRIGQQLGRYPIRIICFCCPSVELSAHRHGHDVELTQTDGHWAY